MINDFLVNFWFRIETSSICLQVMFSLWIKLRFIDTTRNKEWNTSIYYFIQSRCECSFLFWCSFFLLILSYFISRCFIWVILVFNCLFNPCFNKINVSSSDIVNYSVCNPELRLFFVSKDNKTFPSLGFKLESVNHFSFFSEKLFIKLSKRFSLESMCYLFLVFNNRENLLSLFLKKIIALTTYDYICSHYLNIDIIYSLHIKSFVIR